MTHDDWPFPLGTPPDGWGEADDDERVRIFLAHQRAQLHKWRQYRDDMSTSVTDDRANANEIIASLMGQIDGIEGVAYGPDPTMQKVLDALAERAASLRQAPPNR